MNRIGQLHSPRGLAHVALVLCVIAVLIHTRLLQPRIEYDDAYVHFRVALNIAHGYGPVFNRGEAVLGTTSPVFAAMLGLVHRATGLSVPASARTLNLCAELAMTLICLSWLRRCGAGLLFRHCAAVVLLLEPYRMCYSLGGMEMSLFLLLSMAVFDLCRRGRWCGAGLLLGILGWVRPEAVTVWLAVTIAYGATRRWLELSRTMAVAVPVSILVAALLAATAGSAIPHSVIAKHAAPWFEPGGQALLYLVRLGDMIPLRSVHGVIASWGSTGDRINSMLMASATLVIVTAGLVRIFQSGQRFAGCAIASFTVGQYLFYALLAPKHFPWYYIPYFFGIMFMLALGWHALGTHAGEHLMRNVGLRRPGSRHVVCVLGCAVYLAMHVVWASFWLFEIAADGACSPTDRLWLRMRQPEPENRPRAYAAAAQLLNSLDASATAGCTEIGAFGYWYKGRIFDAYGLVSPAALDVMRPEVTAQLPPGCRTFPANVFMWGKPEFIVSFPMFFPNVPADFMMHYDAYSLDGTGLRVFARKDRTWRLEACARMERLDNLP